MPGPIRIRGFTLIELIAALGLCALLMVGLMSVVRTIADPALDPTLKVKAGQSNHASLDGWLELLRHDLAHAQSLVRGENRLELRGLGTIDPGSGRVTHRPARVVYELKEVGGQTWLVRTQEALDELTNFNRHVELVCRGIQRWALVPEDTRAGPQWPPVLGSPPFGERFPPGMEPPLPRGATPQGITAGVLPDRFSLLVQADGLAEQAPWTRKPLVIR